MVTHPSTNRARRRETSLIDQRHYQLRQTATIGGLGTSWAPPVGSGNILAYFKSHRILLFAPTGICRCFEFVKQCFMSHLGARPRFRPINPHPKVEPRLQMKSLWTNFRRPWIELHLIDSMSQYSVGPDFLQNFRWPYDNLRNFVRRATTLRQTCDRANSQKTS